MATCGDDGDDTDDDDHHHVDNDHVDNHHVDNHHIDDHLSLTLQQRTGLSWGLWGKKEEEVKSRFL